MALPKRRGKRFALVQLKLSLPVLLVLEIEIDEYSAWRRLTSWGIIRDQHDILPCAVCREYAETRTFLSPDGLESEDVCRRCEEKLGSRW